MTFAVEWRGLILRALRLVLLRAMICDEVPSSTHKKKHSVEFKWSLRGKGVAKEQNWAGGHMRWTKGYRYHLLGPTLLNEIILDVPHSHLTQLAFNARVTV